MSIYDSRFVIYSITNRINGKVYIGQTSQKVEIRWRDHLKAASLGSHNLIHRAIAKYGVESFDFSILCNALDQSHLDSLEKLFIEEHNSCIHDDSNHGYNMTRGGDGFDSESSRKTQMARVAAGTHPFAGEVGSNYQKQRLANGTHNWSGIDFSAQAKARNKSDGNPWSGENGSKRMAKFHAERLANGTHCTQKEFTCPHCGKTGKGPNMKRYHFDNCKANPGYWRILL